MIFYVSCVLSLGYLQFRSPTGYLSGLMNKYILSNLLGYDVDQTILNKEKNNDRVFMPMAALCLF
jgi:hypothetical protein